MRCKCFTTRKRKIFSYHVYSCILKLSNRRVIRFALLICNLDASLVVGQFEHGRNDALCKIRLLRFASACPVSN